MEKIKERNEQKMEKVAKRKALLEAESRKKALQLYEKEKREMSPIFNGTQTSMMRTFNASATIGNCINRTRHSLPAFDFAPKKNITTRIETSPDKDIQPMKSQKNALFTTTNSWAPSNLGWT